MFNNNNVKIDKNAIYINDEPTILFASSFFYFRIPREKWRARMKLLKLAGYNTIDVYFPWNYHESEPDIWDFDGQRDIEAFLNLAKEENLYVIARPGPYICSEWDGGALPSWLYSKELPVRQDDPLFLKELFKWYEKLIPILKKYQIDNNGTIILFQVENELDFFHCYSPASYMYKLSRKALDLGITVPMFYCCGQNDMSRSGFPIDIAIPTFNVYSDDNDPSLEERCRNLRNLAKDQSVPLMVSETNRTHSYLKRLLCSGARLLSPYNQVAGTTMEFYTGVTNWGPIDEPVSYMTTNYDFDSMISSSGTVGNEFLQARLFTELINTFPEIASSEIIYNDQIKVSDIFNKEIENTLSLKSNDFEFYPISNLNNHKAKGSIIYKDEKFNMTLPANYTALLPLSIELDRFKGQGQLLYSNYEIGYFDAPNNTLVIYGLDNWNALYINGNQIEKININVPENGIAVEYGGITFSCLPLEKASGNKTPRLDRVPEGLLKKEKSTKVNISSKESFDFHIKKSKESNIDYMEKLDQYRGFGSYEVRFEEEGDILLHDCSDLIEISSDGKFEKFLYSPGTTISTAVKAGQYRFLTEIWGHSNFDDIRYPVLQMGSLKGIRKITFIKDKKDISANWRFQLDSSGFDRAPDCHYSSMDTVMNIDQYNRNESPLTCIFRKLIKVHEDCNSYVLNFEKANCLIKVYVNGNFVKQVSHTNPYVDISEFITSGDLVDITLHTLRKFWSDEVGKITLISGEKIDSCLYGEANLPVYDLENNMDYDLPLDFKKGEKAMLSLTFPDLNKADLVLYCKVNNVKLTFVKDEFVIARIIPLSDKMPSMKGGDPTLVYIPGEWLENNESITVYAQAIGENPSIIGFDAKSIPWIFEEKSK